MHIEIFRTGKHIDSLGRIDEYTEKSLDDIAAKYNIKVAGDISQRAAIVKGHPKTDDPAFGWVEYLMRKGEKLYAKVIDLDENFRKELMAKKYTRVSISLYPDLTLKHIGFLGAAHAAVNKLNPVEFNEINDDSANQIKYQSIYFDFAEAKTDDENPNESFDEKLQKLEELVSQYSNIINNYEKEIRIDNFRNYCNSMIMSNDKSGYPPAYVKYLTDIMEMAHNADTQQGIENYTVNSDLVKEFISLLSNTVKVNEFKKSEVTKEDAAKNFAGKNIDSARLELHLEAMNLMKKRPELSYNEAVIAATNK